MNSIRALGFDTSNYATSLAAVNPSAREVVCAKKRFLPVKEGEQGLRQSDAVFHHTAALPILLREMQGEGALNGICAVGVSVKPRPAEGSYMPCFSAGYSAATAFAAALGVPLVETTHQQGHIAAALFGAGLFFAPEQEFLLFHISGGTTELLLCEGTNVKQTLGQTLDLYAGQAVDRLGVRLGFSFPAGEALSTLAEACPDTFAPRITLKGQDCHLSGLQNQCEGMLAKGEEPSRVAKYCLSFIAHTVLAMVQDARRTHPGLQLLLAGGVMCSSSIRDIIKAELPEALFVPPALSADNAVGTALIAAKEAL